MKLNLGAGPVRREGYLSVDLYHPDADVKCDLSRFPWPWPDGSVEAVNMSHFLEHVDDVGQVVREVWRILQDGGVWEVDVPHKDGMTAYLPYHTQRMGLQYMAELGFCDQSWYSDYRLFRTTRLRLTFKPSRFYGPLRFVFPLLERIANCHRSVRSAWEFIHLPTDSIHWSGIKVARH